MVAPRNFNPSTLPRSRTNLVDYVNDLSEHEYQQYEIWRIENRDNFIQEYNDTLDDDNFSLGSARSYLDELIRESDNEDSEDSDNENSEEDSDDEDSDDEESDDEIESESETIIDDNFEGQRNLRNDFADTYQEEYGPEEDSSCDTVYTYDSDSDLSSDDEYSLGETRIVFNYGCNLLI